MADRKIGFQVVFASGQDADYPVTELNYHSPQTKGWQSPRCVMIAAAARRGARRGAASGGGGR